MQDVDHYEEIGGLVDKIADKLGIASQEVISGVEVLAEQYAIGCWSVVIMCLVGTIFSFIVGYFIRRSIRMVISEEDTYRKRENTLIVNAITWTFTPMIAIILLALAGYNAFCAYTANLQVLKELLVIFK